MNFPDAWLGSARRRKLLADNAIFLALIVIYLVAILVSDAFLSANYMGNVLRQVAPVGIAAIGVTYVMILGGVDLSIGAVISLSAVVCAVQMNGDAGNMPWAIFVTCLIGATIGLANGIIVAFTRVSPFILTLGTGIAVNGLTQIYSGGTARGIVSPGFREFFNQRIAEVMPVLALAFLAAALLGYLIQRQTLFGHQLFLIGSNRRAAIISGLPVRRVTMTAYCLAGLCGALAGIVLLARSGVSNTLSGQGLEFQVLAAVVLGGTTFEGGRGGIAGTVAGTLVLIIAFNLVNISGLPYHLQLVVMGAIIIGASSIYGQLSLRSR